MSSRSDIRAAGAQLVGIGVEAAAAAVETATNVVTGLRAGSPREDQAMKTKNAITVRRPLEDVYGYWRAFENLPEFMWHLESVSDLGNGRSRWVAKAPAGTSVEWGAEIVEETPGEVIAWRSVEGSTVQNSGVVRFAPAPRDQGTEVIIELEYVPPGGALGAAVAKVFGEEPDQQVRDDLRRFKQVMETGEVVLSDGTPDGTRTQRQLNQRPAQPLED